MNNFIVILCCVFVVAMIAVIQTYREMDKRRFHSRQFWAMMEEHIDEWMTTVDHLSREPQLEESIATRLRLAVEDYRGAKNPEEKANCVNEASRMCALLEKDLGCLAETIVACLDRLNELRVKLHSAAGFYNNKARAVNSALDRPVFGALSEKMGFSRASELSDF